MPLEPDTNNNTAILHLSDWNYNDKYYNVPIPILEEFRTKIKTQGIKPAWQWFKEHITHYGPATPEKPVDMEVNANKANDAYFLDYENPIESVNEWEDQ